MSSARYRSKCSSDKVASSGLLWAHRLTKPSAEENRAWNVDVMQRHSVHIMQGILRCSKLRKNSQVFSGKGHLGSAGLNPYVVRRRSKVSTLRKEGISRSLDGRRANESSLGRSLVLTREASRRSREETPPPPPPSALAFAPRERESLTRSSRNQEIAIYFSGDR